MCGPALSPVAVTGFGSPAAFWLASAPQFPPATPLWAKPENVEVEPELASTPMIRIGIPTGAP